MLHTMACLIFHRKTAFPSSLQQKKSRQVRKPERVFTYDRDIVCMPKSSADKDGLVKIPRKKDFLASNKQNTIVINND